jgi:hypothetical protein
MLAITVHQAGDHAQQRFIDAAKHLIDHHRNALTRRATRGRVGDRWRGRCQDRPTVQPSHRLSDRQGLK